MKPLFPGRLFDFLKAETVTDIIGNGEMGK